MRTFNFKARNIGQERYLTYTMGEECELDEDALDYCETNKLKELVSIIYEEDDDYDYLTYDITGRISLDDFIKEEMNCEKVLFILRNVANNLISLKEQAIHLSYVLLNRSFIYVDENSFEISFICLPVESKGSVMLEFKSFMRQLLANMRYDVEEDLSYVGKLLTYINGSNFNLRGLIGLAEALMEEAGISFEEAGAIDADGVEVVSSEEVNQTAYDTEAENISDFMNQLSESDEALPEIGDDIDDADETSDTDGNIDGFDMTSDTDGEIDSILPAGMEPVSHEQPESMQEEINEESLEEQVITEEITDEPEEEQPVQQAIPAAVREKEAVTEANEARSKETDIDLIKDRIKQLVGDVPSAKPISTGKNIKTIEDLDEYLDSKPPVVKRTVVKVNRAAIIQNVAAEHEAEQESERGAEEDIVKEAEDKTEKLEQLPVIEEIYEDMNVEKSEKPKSKSILSKSVDIVAKTISGDTAKNANNLLNAPKIMPYLIRVNTDERIMLNKPTFKLGKASMGVDYTVGGNGAISRQHAVILQKDGVCYIKDNKSTNHTYVNDKMVDDGVEEILTHDSMIKLGDEEFIFKIR